MSHLLVAVLAAAAAASWWGPLPRVPPAPGPARAATPRPQATGAWAGSGRAGSWIARGWRRLRGRRTSRDAARAVLEVCDLLAAELMAGRPPGAALSLASRQWPPLEPVSEAFSLGADVPTALRRVAESVPGAGDLRVVAAAWQVSHHSGRGLARALERVARGMRARRRTRRVVESELASARATARLVAVLPLAVLTMGSGAGGDPWAFLLTTPVGIGCLVVGGLLTALGLGWIELIAERAIPS